MKEENVKFIKNYELTLNYSNAVTINSNYMDFQFVFSQQIVEENVVVKELCKVVMSPQHAKVFRDLLDNQIKKYEKYNGEIYTPEIKEQNGV